MKKIKGAFTIITLCLAISLCHGSISQAKRLSDGRNLLISAEYYHLISEWTYKFELNLIDNRGKLIKTMTFPGKPPNVTKLEDNLYEIGISFGPLTRYVFYFDAELGEVTRTYFNPIYVDNYIIAHRENRTTDEGLIIEELFVDDGIHTEIIRDFSLVAINISVISEISLVDENTIRVVYQQGRNYKEITEEITFR